MDFARLSAIHQVADVLEPLVTHAVIDGVGTGVRVGFQPTSSNKNSKLRDLLTATHERGDGSLDFAVRMLMASAQSSHTKGGAQFTGTSYLNLIEALRALGADTDEYRDFARRHLNFDPRPLHPRNAPEEAPPRLVLSRNEPAFAADPPMHNPSSPTPRPSDPMIKREPPDPKRVFIIYGRNHEAKKQLGIFLSAAGLQVLKFEEVRASLKGTPTIGDIITEAMHRALAVIALFTPDEFAHLRPEPEFASGGDKKDPELVSRWQARPNVIFEAGLAFGINRDRLIPVVFGDVALFTDVGGIHLLRPTNHTKGDRQVLFETLKAIGCSVNDSLDWQDHGDFETCVSKTVATSSPFPKP